MSISSVLNPMVFATSATTSVGAQASSRAASSGGQPKTSINDAFTGVSVASALSSTSNGLVAPRSAASAMRASKNAGLPALSADAYLDLQQSVDVLSQSFEGLSAIRAAQHAVTMGIIRNLG